MATGIKSFFLKGPAGRLEALLNQGAPDATHAALVCHPHPLYGGTMHNKVVYHAMKALSGFGFPVLRFNFRGAGLSDGEHDKGQGEQADVRAALDWLGTPVSAEGRVYTYHYLQNCTQPKLFVSGAQDQYGPTEHIWKVVELAPEPKELVIVEEAGHFFEGHLAEMQ